jgi:hypothetical protein
VTAKPPRFNVDDADRAHAEWGANCGPGALAAISGMTLDELRPHMGDFESKHYTNPTLMFECLKRLGVRHHHVRPIPLTWPKYGLVRIQWEGPWTLPGVPMRARYRYTHWVGSARRGNVQGVFDINCIDNGSGWCSQENWTSIVVPYLCALYPRATGGWHITHAIEVVLDERAAK